MSHSETELGQRVNSTPACSKLPDIREMYQTVRGHNEEFGIDGYDPLREYLDPNKQIKEREFYANIKKTKGKKDPTKYVTKRGSYIDLHYKQHPIDWPGPQHKTFHVKKEEPKKQLTTKEKEKFKKMSFIDQIYHDNKKENYPKPGPGKYNIRQTEEQYKDELKKLKERKMFICWKKGVFCDKEYLGWNNPGAGAHDPKLTQDIQKVPLSIYFKQKHSDWIKKHKDETKSLQSKHKNPDFGSYKPFHQDYETFGYTQFIWDRKRKEKDLGKVQYWGTDERFHDPKKTKIKNQWHIPGANTYDLQQYWPVKLDAKNKDKYKDKKNIMDRITKGITRSIYY